MSQQRVPDHPDGHGGSHVTSCHPASKQLPQAPLVCALLCVLEIFPNRGMRTAAFKKPELPRRCAGKRVVHMCHGHRRRSEREASLSLSLSLSLALALCGLSEF